ncbi:MAG: nucleotidyl transferase AbiEii/AbiGii toxin family protein [Bacteroidota bacterium]
MLHYTTIEPDTLELLKAIQSDKALAKFLLVGGTALALQIGHRKSIDLDFFSTEQIDLAPIPDILKEYGTTNVTNQSKRVLNTFVRDIKVDFVSYQYPLISKPITENGIILCSVRDIAAMKLAAVTGRGSKKDFIDIFFLLKDFTLSELLSFFSQKYPDGSQFLVYKSLTYFNDAEADPMPIMLIDTSWPIVKDTIVEAVKKTFV